MVTTKTQICNLALSELGESRNQLTDFDIDDDAVAVQCQLHYPQALEELTRIHAWNCCINRAQLTTSAYTGHGWDYTAALPSGCLRVLEIVSTDVTFNNPGVRVKWAVEGANIRVNYTDPYITYMAEPAIAAMDSLFVQALYTFLAAKLAVPLKGDNGRNLRAQLMGDFFGAILPQAKSLDGFEDDNIYDLDSDYLDASYNSFYRYEYPFYQTITA